jgi:hypothetical protein
LAVRTDPAPYLASLAAYNSGPKSARIAGKLRASGKGSADFGAAVSAGEGLRLDAVAGPFASPVFAAACEEASGCRAYVPSRQTVYVDREGSWGDLLEQLLLGRVPVIGDVAGGWLSSDGAPVVLFRGAEGWEERVELNREGVLPDRVFLGRRDDDPLIRVSYEEFETAGGHPFPRRIAVSVRKPRQEYEISVRRIEPAAEIDPNTFKLPSPPGAREENVEGRATWNETAIPLWPKSSSRPRP